MKSKPLIFVFLFLIGLVIFIAVTWRSPSAVYQAEWDEILDNWPLATPFRLTPEDFKKHINAQVTGDEPSRMQAFYPLAQEIQLFIEATDYNSIFDIDEDDIEVEVQNEWYRQHHETIYDFHLRVLATAQYPKNYFTTLGIENGLLLHFLPEAGQLRRAARFFRNASLAAWRSGEPELAFDYLETLHYLGEELAEPFSLIEFLTLVAVRGIRNDLIQSLGWEALGHSRWADVEKDLMTQIQLDTRLAQVIPAEVMFGLEAFAILDSGDRLKMRELGLFDFQPSGLRERIFLWFYSNMGLWRADKTNYLEIMREMQEVTLENLFQRAEAGEYWADSRMDQTNYRFLLSNILVPAMNRVVTSELINLTQTRMLLIASAIRRYADQNGTLPKDLTDLDTPSGLNLLINPLDGKPIHYEITGDGFLLLVEHPNRLSHQDNPLALQFTLKPAASDDE